MEPVRGHRPTAALEEFVLNEARLLDNRHFEQWVELFAKDGDYWVPMTWDQPDPVNHISLIFETVPILEIRMRRLVHEATASQFPHTRTFHHVTNLLQFDAPKGEHRLEGGLLFAEHRRAEQRFFSGVVTWHLRETPQGLKIGRKTVRLLNCDQETGHLRLAVPF